MCTKTCIEFGQYNLQKQDIRGKTVLEVGAYDVNGSLRPFVEALAPATYIGVDIKIGPGVDEICNANDLVERFGAEKFDVLISTELIEHTRDWRRVISNFKRVLKPNGVLLITTRSKGFWYHAWPDDYWRYEVEDIRAIFSDFVIERLEKDPGLPGVFIKATKPEVFAENDLARYKLYSMIRAKHVVAVRDIDILLFEIKYQFRQLLHKILPSPMQRIIKKRVKKNIH